MNARANVHSGSFGCIYSTSGVLTTKEKTSAAIMNYLATADDNGKSDLLTLDLSKGNSIYQSNGIIRPKSISVLVLLRL